MIDCVVVCHTFAINVDESDEGIDGKLPLSCDLHHGTHSKSLQPSSNLRLLHPLSLYIISQVVLQFVLWMLRLSAIALEHHFHYDLVVFPSDVPSAQQKVRSTLFGLTFSDVYYR